MKQLVLCMFVLSLLGCGTADEQPDCMESIRHFYSIECTIVYNGEYLPLGNALGMCTFDWEGRCAECIGEHNELVACFAKLNYNECAACNSRFEDLDTCLAYATTCT